MIVMRNMDELFDIDLPEGWIAAGHVCACNPMKFSHYPADWYELLYVGSTRCLTSFQGFRELRIHALGASHRSYPPNSGSNK